MNNPMPKDNEVDEKVIVRFHATGDYAYPVDVAEDGEYVLHDDYAATVAELRAEVVKERERAEKFMWQVRDTCARAEAAELRVGELEAALQAYQSAEAMSNYGDYSDFVFPKRSMRKEGEPEWGWICEKHGLGYWGGCVCCADDFKDHQNRKDREASYARNEALSAARQLAATTLTGADPT